MKWRGIGAVVVSLVLFAGIGAAQITIHSPSTGVHSTDAIKIDLEADSGLKIVNYSIAPDNIVRNVGEQNVTQAELLSQGRHTLTAVADDGSNVKRNFTVDSESPVVTYKSPEGTVFDREPGLTIEYEDVVSAVDENSVAVWLDGERISGNVTDTAFTNDLENISEGQHNLSITLSDTVGNDAQPVIWSFTLPKKPVLSNVGPKGLIDGNDATVSLNIRDPSGINPDKSSLDIHDGDGNRVTKVDFDDDVENIDNKTARSKDGKKISVSHALSDLKDGIYTVEAEVTDTEGHTTTTEWTFTVDTSAPSLSILSHNDGDVVKGSQTFVVKATDTLSAVKRVKVSLGGETEQVYTAVDNKFHVDIDTNDVGDGTQELSVAAYDKADNRASKNIDLMVDNTAPIVRNVEVYPNTVPVQAKVSATVRDRATGIKSVSYSVKDAGMTGTLMPVDGAFDEDTEDVYGTLKVEELDKGEHTLYVIANDGAGHSTTKSSSFNVDQSRSSTLALERTDTVLADASSRKTFTVRVSNKGDANDLVSVSSSASIVTKVQPQKKRIHAGETKGFDVTVDIPADATLGPRDIPLTIKGFGTKTHASVSVSVQPTPTGQTQIEQRLQNLEDTFSSLSSSKDEYDDQVSAEDAGATFSETQTVLSEIESLIDEGRYYAASQRLDDAEAQIAEAETALTGMISRHKRNQLISTILKSLAVLLFVGISIGVYRLAPGKEGFDNENGFVFHEDDRHPLERKWEDVQKSIQERLAELSDGSKERKAEREQPNSWNGFN